MKQDQLRFKGFLAVMAGCVIAAAAAHAEVYRWTDEDGVTHFSETPPPGGQEAEIKDVALKPTAEEQAGAGIDFDGTAEPVAEEMSAADLKRMEIALSREQGKAQRRAHDAVCNQARDRLAEIEPSRRVYYTDQNGETVRMDDEERVAEVQRLHGFLDANCR